MPPRPLSLAFAFLLLGAGYSVAESGSYHPAPIPRPGSRCSERDKESWSKVKWGVGPFQAPSYDPCYWEHLRFIGITEKKWNEPDADRCGWARDHAVEATQACSAVTEAVELADRSVKPAPGQDPKDRRVDIEKALQEVEAKLQTAEAAFRKDSPQVKDAVKAQKKIKIQLRTLEARQAAGKANERMKASSESGALKTSRHAEKELKGGKSAMGKKEVLDVLFDQRSAGKPDASGRTPQPGSARLKGDRAAGGQLRDTAALSAADKYALMGESPAMPPPGPRAGPAMAAPGAPPRPRFYDDQMRAPMMKALSENPVGKEFALPVFKKDKALVFDIKGPKDEDGPAEGSWASYRAHRFVFNRDLINKDIQELNNARGAEPGWHKVDPIVPDQPLTADQKDLLAHRYMPVTVHEIGGHGRHDMEIEAKLGNKKEVPYVKDTEYDAFRLEAMSIVAERRRDPKYLKDATGYGQDAGGIADAYLDSKVRKNPKGFRDFIDTFGYDGLVTVSDKSKPELQAIGNLTKKTQADCDKDFLAQRCQDGLEASQKGMSTKTRREVEAYRQIGQTAYKQYMKEHPDADEQKTHDTFTQTAREKVDWFLKLASIRLGDDPKTMEQVGGYFKQEETRIAKADKKMFGDPAKDPIVLARIQETSPDRLAEAPAGGEAGVSPGGITIPSAAAVQAPPERR